MFRRILPGWLILALLVVAVPIEARSGFGHRHCGRCGKCSRSLNPCGCPQPACGGCRIVPSNCCSQAPFLQPQMMPQMMTGYQQNQNPILVQQTPIVTSQVMTFVPQSNGEVATGVPYQHGSATLGHPEIGMTPVPMATAPVDAPTATAMTVSPAPNHEQDLDHRQQTIPQAAPSASSQSSEWSKVPARKSAGKEVQLQAYEYETPVPTVSASPSFRHVPTAATVWRSQGAFSRN